MNKDAKRELNRAINAAAQAVVCEWANAGRPENFPVPYSLLAALDHLLAARDA